MTPTTIAARARDLYDAHLKDVWVRSDRMFSYLLVIQWLAGIVIAFVYSPTAWDGATSAVHLHVWAAIFGGGLISGVPVALAVRRPGWVWTRHAVAVGQMLTSALLIHLTGGRIETHFHVFGSLAFLAFYRDWRVLLTATLVVAIEHAIRGIFWPESVYGIAYASAWRFLEHAFWVAFEDVVLVFGCVASLREMRSIARTRADLEEARVRLTHKERLEREMEIASKIQTSILPRKLQVEGLEIAAQMVPASEVGGDYYDVLPVNDGCWIGIGDVSGHGLTAGLVMMMMQSSISTLGRTGNKASPREVLSLVNDVLFENIRDRIADDSHATLSLLRYGDAGKLTFAGAHEDILVSRADGRCEVVETPGPWVGAVRNIRTMAVDTEAQLEIGDVMLLYTDGVTEAMNAEGEQFGLGRLAAELTRVRDMPVDTIRDHLIDVVKRWTAQQQDDVTVLVLRRAAVVTPALAA